jgi:hypothetical protein
MNSVSISVVQAEGDQAINERASVLFQRQVDANSTPCSCVRKDMKRQHRFS